MPLIWDDNQYQLVDEDDEYDKTRFVVARKLFVKLNKRDDDESQVVQSVLFTENPSNFLNCDFFVDFFFFFSKINRLQSNTWSEISVNSVKLNRLR